MNILRKLSISTIAKPWTTNKYMVEMLKNRDLIRVHGDESEQFLQGLITNDMAHLNHGSSMYAMFLNKAGRVLYDSIIYSTRDKNTYIIECDKSIEYDLRRHLRMFRVRKKIDIDSIGSEYTPWVLFSKNVTLPTLKSTLNKESLHDILLVPDPRLKTLGTRLIVPKNFDIDDIIELFHKDIVIKPSDDQNNYTTLRYSLGVGEGIENHPPTKCFPLEVNCDYLHGVSFQKGCYLGQELTARIHHTGIIRKRLMSMVMMNKPDNNTLKVQLLNGNDVGNIRGICNNFVMALVRLDKVLKVPQLMIDGDRAKLITPDWWPISLPPPKEINEINNSELKNVISKDSYAETKNTKDNAKAEA